jgi:hypothetical protein
MLAINQKKEVFGYDVEQFPNFHSAVFISLDKEREYTFIIHDSRNDIEAYFTFLSKKVKGLVGFNNVGYDYPLIHFLINEIYHKKELWNNPTVINNMLFIESGRIINEKFSAIASWKTLLPQLDVFKIHHFDNIAKMTSLKWVQFVMRWENVEDLTIDFTKEIETTDIPKIIKYNRNDVLSTLKFYEITLPEVKLRQQIGKSFNIDCLNLNDVKIGETLFLKYIELKTGLTKKEIKSKVIQRDTIAFEDCILDYINFKTKNFQNTLESIKDTVVSGTKQEFTYKFIQDEVIYKYGSGGLHAQNKPGVYKKDDQHLIIDIDVSSFYPSLAVQNGFFPEHLGMQFCEIYKDRYDYRMTIKPDKSKSLEAGTWKLGLNGIYGKSGDKYSPFYDPKYTMKTTLNGQLLLSMLTERLIMNIESLQIIQINTDGITAKIHNDSLDELMNICKAWERKTGLTLEYGYYKKFIMRDVNNYIAVYDKPEEELKPQFSESDWYDNSYTKHKTKGSFQVVPEANGKIAFNKDWSMRVVKKALHDYYIYNIPIKDSIMNNTDILDYCKVFRNKGGSKAEFINSKIETIPLSKTTRYFISNNGGKIIKIYDSGKKELVEATGKITIFNKIENKHISEYMINYGYYIRECNKEINKIEQNGQLKIF